MHKCSSLLVLGSLAAFARAQTTECASAMPGGAPAGGSLANVTPDGRYVVFASSAALVAGDTNVALDAYVRDRACGTLERVSVSTAGVQGNSSSGHYHSAITPDGRFIAFVSAATSLVAGDTNAKEDVFVRDRLNGTTVRASVGAAGLQSDGASYRPSISDDGNLVAFQSYATNLIGAADTNGIPDVFVRSISAGTTERVSVGAGAVQGTGQSFGCCISGTGRYVVFQSDSSNLVAGDTNGNSDLFVRDRVTATTTRVSLSSGGIQGNSGSFASPTRFLSGNGRYVAIYSGSNNLVAGDTNAASDIFLRDRDTDGDGIFDEAGAVSTVRVSVGPGGGQGNGSSVWGSLSHNGRCVAFYSYATNWFADVNGTSDVFVHDSQTGETRMSSVDSAGVQASGASFWPAVSNDGNVVSFESDATNLAPGDVNGARDVFVRDTTPPPPATLGTERVSLDSAEVEGAGPSNDAYVSADGGHVGFASDAANLVGVADTNGVKDVFVRDRAAGTTERVSVDSFGAEGFLFSDLPSLSADGSQVAFVSDAPSLDPPDGNGAVDVFVRNRMLGETVLVSLNDLGVEGDGDSYTPIHGGPSISPDGRFVAFVSLATNLSLDAFLVPNDFNGVPDVFVHDRDADFDGTLDERGFGEFFTRRVSLHTSGTEGAGMSGKYGIWISVLGRFTAFQSFAANLVDDDFNGDSDIFVHELATAVTERVSLDSAEMETHGFAWLPSISADLTLAADGRYVSFSSTAPDLVVGDTNGDMDIFVRDRAAGTTVRVSVDTSSGDPDGGSFWSMVSAGGQWVVYESAASDLVAADLNFVSDIFRVESATLATELISLDTLASDSDGPSHVPTVSADGASIAFDSTATDLIAADTNFAADAFVVDLDLDPSWTVASAPGPYRIPSGSPGDSGGTGAAWPGTLPAATSYTDIPLAAPVPANASEIHSVEICALTHTFVGDLQLYLIDPSGVGYNLVHRPGFTGAGFGFGCDYGGDYEILAGGPAWPAACASSLVPGAYDQYFGSGGGAWPSGAHAVFNVPLDSIPATPGIWTLRIVDWAAIDIGSLCGWSMSGDDSSVPPVAYCTPTGTTSSGCVPTISATANPNVAHSNTCVVTATSVEGAKMGLFFYGLLPTSSPWCGPGSPSDLCVKAPSQRTQVQVSPGAPGTCAGTLTLDWNAYQLTNFGALGQPWATGTHVYVQGWFRDPLMCKFTFLTQALDMTYRP